MAIGSDRLAGRMVIGAVAYYVLVLAALHFLEPEFDPLRTPMSIYVLGVYGRWMTTTYFVLSAAWLGVAYGLSRTLARTSLTMVAVALFVIASGAALVAGIFPMDPLSAARPAEAMANAIVGVGTTLPGRLHAIGGLFTFPSIVFGTLLFSLGFRRDPIWRRVAVPALALAAGMVMVFVLATVSLRVLGFAGYAQRLLFALLFAWMIVVARQLTRSPDERRRDDPQPV